MLKAAAAAARRRGSAASPEPAAALLRSLLRRALSVGAWPARGPRGDRAPSPHRRAPPRAQAAAQPAPLGRLDPGPQPRAPQQQQRFPGTDIAPHRGLQKESLMLTSPVYTAGEGGARELRLWPPGACARPAAPCSSSCPAPGAAEPGAPFPPPPCRVRRGGAPQAPAARQPAPAADPGGCAAHQGSLRLGHWIWWGGRSRGAARRAVHAAGAWGAAAKVAAGAHRGLVLRRRRADGRGALAPADPVPGDAGG
jgi:hypothetical protein